MYNEALTYAQTHQAENLDGLKEIIRIPSISTLPEHTPDIERAADWLINKLTEIGLENAQKLDTSGHPMVYADWLHAGDDKPTVLLYGHYDVQPIDPLELWDTPPFEPTVKGDKLYARGADDNKGQFYCHVAAIEAYMQSSGRLPINLKFMIEGEEECGSPNLGEFMNAHKELLACDVAVISDTAMVDANTPVITVGVRGLAYMEVTLRGSTQDLHSGGYGGVVENPLNAMSKLIAKLWDEQNRVTIPGFYDRVREFGPLDKELFVGSGRTDKLVLETTGAPQLWGDPAFSVAERLGGRPTLDVHGIKGGFIGAGSKTVIPAEATAKISMRLVPDQQADEIAQLFEQYITELAPPTMTVKVRKLSAENGAVIPTDSPYIEAAATAFEHGFGQTPIMQREGGTLPIVAYFIDTLKTDVAMLGFGLPDDHIHAPNERYHLPNFYRGIETAIHYYQLVGKS